MKNLKMFCFVALLVIMFVLITPVKVKADECPDCDALFEAYASTANNVNSIADALDYGYTALGFCYENPNEDPQPCVDWWSSYISDMQTLYDAAYTEYAAAADAYANSGCP